MATAQTRNPFVPAIDRFNQFLQGYMQQQGQLTEKMYALNREQKIKTLSASYSESLNKAKNPGELSQMYAEGVAESFRQGIPEAAQLIGQFANVKAGALDYQQKREFAQNTLDILGTQLKGVKFQYGDDQVEFDKIIGQLPNDPLQALNIAENVVKTGKLQKKSSVGIDPSKGIVGGTYQEDQFGRQTNYQPFVNTGTTVYEDKGIIGKVDEADTLASPEVQADFSRLYTQKLESERSRAAQYGRMDRTKIYNPVTKELKDGLVNTYTGEMYTIQDGKKGSLVTDPNWVEYNRMIYDKQMSVSSVKLAGSMLLESRGELNTSLAPVFKKGSYIDSKGNKVSLNTLEKQSGAKYVEDYELKKMMDEFLKREELEGLGKWGDSPLNIEQRVALKEYKEKYLPRLKQVQEGQYQHMSQYDELIDIPGLYESRQKNENLSYGIKPSEGVPGMYEVEIDGRVLRGNRDELEQYISRKNIEKFKQQPSPLVK